MSYEGLGAESAVDGALGMLTISKLLPSRRIDVDLVLAQLKFSV